jgi:hypothetical protein
MQRLHYVAIFHQELDLFGVRVREWSKCSIIVASVESVDKNSTKVSQRIALVSEKMKDGILLLFRYGISQQNQLTTYTRKTIIVTGNY